MPSHRSRHLGVSALVVTLLTAGVVVGWGDGPAQWKVHDMNRPQPRVVTPGGSGSAAPIPPPSDAVVLFDGSDLSEWVKRDGQPAGWKVEDGAMVVTRSGDVRTKREFGSCQLHIEWAAPKEVKGDGQGRGNSGIYIMSRYEVQVLDSFENKTYPDGQAAAVYGQNPPLVNACRAPGEWQTYDIVFRRPHFDDEGKAERPGTVTVFHNGVLVQDHFAIWGSAAHKRVATYEAHSDQGPLLLQDHGNPVRFRNIWVRPLED